MSWDSIAMQRLCKAGQQSAPFVGACRLSAYTGFVG
jgi:hypothetical protein